MKKMTRRQFLSYAAGGLAAYELGRMFPGLRLTPVSPVKAQAFPKAAAAIGTETDSAGDILATALLAVGGLENLVRPGQTVVIKPNATWAYPPRTASSTDPELLRAVIQLVKNAGAGKIIVMDHCSIDPGTAEAIRINGIARVVKEEDVEGIFPDRTNAPPSTYTRIDFPNGKAFQNLGVIKAAVEADVRINMAVAKTHNVTKMTMCLKHMMGFLQAPGLIHSSIEQGIADLSTPSPIQAHLHILEALRVRLPYGNYRVCAGPETDLTNPKVVRPHYQIIAGTDPVLIDAYGTTTFFEMLPEELAHLQKAYEAGIGDMDLQAALDSGQMVAIQVGQSLATATPYPTVSPTSAESTNLQATAVPAAELANQATPTPLPTAAPEAAGEALPVGIHASSDQNCTTQVINPFPQLNAALVPAALIVTGAGVAIRAQMGKNKPGSDGQPAENDHEN